MDLDLFDGEDDTQVLCINKEYAERYQNWREKEEVQKIKDRYGDAAALKMAFDDEDDSTSEEEDENAEALTEDVEKEFFRTLSYLKQKDPKIYDENTEFFSNSDKIKGKERNKIKEKPVFLKDYERELLLKTEGKVDKLEGNEWTSSEKQSKGYFEEQEEIKKNLKRLVDESDEDESEDLLVVRKKSDKEKATEEAEYRAWLLGQTTNVKDTYFKEDTRALHDVWTDPNLDKNEAFLRDFILNKRYLDQEDDNHIPTYNEIVHDSEGDLSEDEETLEKQGEFENKFNFRFEEPDHDFIKRYPRTIANSLRRKDDSRPKKRQEKIERKKEEKQRKKEELKILKAAKRREIEEKLEKLAEITGNENVGFHDDDIEGDFDPEKHDQRMRQLFDDDFYGENGEEIKPNFEFDPEIDEENWDYYGIENQRNKQGQTDDESQINEEDTNPDDPNFNMDADYDPRANFQKEVLEMTSKKKKGKKQSAFAKVLEQYKPVFDPKQFGSYDEYLEEYYKLDYEDIVADMPVRFKYRKVVSNDFGLTTEEILAAREKELNKWCSVKKTCQYRAEEEEEMDVMAFRKKASNILFKKKILPSVFEENVDEILEKEQEEKRQKRKKKKKDQSVSEELMITGENENPKEPPKKKKKKKKKGQKGEKGEIDLHTDNLKVKMDLVEKIANVVENKPKLENKNAAKFIEPSSENKIISAGICNNKKKIKKKLERSDVEDQVISESAESVKVKPSIEADIKKDKLQKVSQKNKRIKKKKKEDFSMGLSDDRLKAYGFNPKKFKNFQKYGKKP